MPNWCNNYITINGEKENMKPIYEFFKENQNNTDIDCLVMSSLVPHDDEYNAIKESGEYLLNPQVNFYGTKWDFNVMEANITSINEDCITLAPSTAWSPPSEFCRRLSGKYGICVDIYYDEPGVGFVGEEEYCDGKLFAQTHYDNYLEGIYKLQPDTFWESAYENIEYYKKEEEFTFETIKETLCSFITDESDLKELESIYNEIE
jgi:hypothetical protein